VCFAVGNAVSGTGEIAATTNGASPGPISPTAAS
jgi:hypothetical protein